MNIFEIPLLNWIAIAGIGCVSIAQAIFLRRQKQKYNSLWKRYAGLLQESLDHSSNRKKK